MLHKITYLIARVVAAFIMLQTLFFKFTGSPESIYIFETVGMEPWGRWMVGILELIASVLLFIPGTVWLGGIFGMGLMLGAIGMHLTLLGIVVMDDGGQLFYYACIVFLCSVFLVFKNKNRIINDVLPKIFRKQ